MDVYVLGAQFTNGNIVLRNFFQINFGKAVHFFFFFKYFSFIPGRRRCRAWWIRSSLRRPRLEPITRPFSEPGLDLLWSLWFCCVSQAFGKRETSFLRLNSVKLREIARQNFELVLRLSPLF